MINILKKILELILNIKVILKQNNMEYSQAWIDTNEIITLIERYLTKPIRQLGIGIRTTEDPADKDCRLYHEEQDEIATEKSKENK